MREVSMAHSVWLCSFCIIFMCFRTSNSTPCKAACLLFGVELKTFRLSQGDKCEISDDLEECPYLEGVLLPLHNSVREELASGRDGWPSASNMMLISWDRKLEILARESLATWLPTSCTLTPEECFWTSSSEDFIENYSMSGRSGGPPDASEVATSWMFLNASEPFDDVVRQKFGRVVRAETTHMGCGDVVFTEKGLSARFLLCLYSPGLDESRQVFTIGDPRDVYTIGDPCSDCPPGTACNETSNYPSLCTEIDVVADSPISDDGVTCSLHVIYYMLVSLVVFCISCKANFRQTSS